MGMCIERDNLRLAMPPVLHDEVAMGTFCLRGLVLSSGVCEVVGGAGLELPVLVPLADEPPVAGGLSHEMVVCLRRGAGLDEEVEAARRPGDEDQCVRRGGL